MACLTDTHTRKPQPTLQYKVLVKQPSVGQLILSVNLSASSLQIQALETSHTLGPGTQSPSPCPPKLALKTVIHCTINDTLARYRGEETSNGFCCFCCHFFTHTRSKSWIMRLALRACIIGTRCSRDRTNPPPMTDYLPPCTPNFLSTCCRVFHIVCFKMSQFVLYPRYLSDKHIPLRIV